MTEPAFKERFVNRFIESQRRICYDDREINFIVKKHVNKIKWKRKGEEYEDRNRK